MNKHLIVMLLGALMSCEYKEEVPPTNSIIEKISFAPSVPLADGVSPVLVQVKIPDKSSKDKITVSLKTTMGIFVESGKSDITVDTDLVEQTDGTFQKIAQVNLQSPQNAGSAVITARASDYLLSSSLEFKNAPAETISVVTDKLSIKKGLENEVRFTVQLSRSQGKPSINQKVKVFVRNPTNNDNKFLGVYREIKDKSDADGKCYFTYSLATDTTYAGPLNVIASYPVSATDSLTNTIKIYSVK